MLLVPGKIKIGGIEMKVVFDKCLAGADNNFGECDHIRGQIKIDETQPEDHKEATLIHEIIEKINTEHELNLEHNQITSLASSIYQVLKDNDLYFYAKERG